MVGYKMNDTSPKCVAVFFLNKASWQLEANKNANEYENASEVGDAIDWTDHVFQLHMYFAVIRNVKWAHANTNNLRPDKTVITREHRLE